MAIVVYADRDTRRRNRRSTPDDALVVKADQELGEESPLEFTDGHAIIEDEAATRKFIDRRSGMHLASGHPEADRDFFEPEEEG